MSLIDFMIGFSIGWLIVCVVFTVLTLALK